MVIHATELQFLGSLASVEGPRFGTKIKQTPALNGVWYQSTIHASDRVGIMEAGSRKTVNSELTLARGILPETGKASTHLRLKLYTTAAFGR